MIYLFLADGFEEIEALTPVDILRRGGKEVCTVSITDKLLVTGARGIPVMADKTITDIKPEQGEMFILPGGLPGADNLEACKPLCDMIVKANEQGKFVCAICAAPKILGKLGIVKGKKAICYPGYEDTLEGAVIADTGVAVDGNVVTANGMSSSLDFALTLLSLVSDKAEKIAKGILYNG